MSFAFLHNNESRKFDITKKRCLFNCALVEMPPNLAQRGLDEENEGASH